MARQTLILDADDTLWQNNVYFENAFEEFCEFLGHSSLTPDEIRDILDEIEIVNNAIHGYGAVNFGRNLSQCYLRLAERAVEEHDLARVTAMAHQILLHEIDPMPGVPETLPFLAERHDLLLCTKGDVAEQTRKIDVSGLRPFFRECIIVKEKNRDTYLQLAAERGLDPDRTWMIGNSPKSDVNPSLAAGLRAVLVPHERTWTLEREDIRDPHGRLLVACGFADLLRIFGPGAR
ncbi:MAG: Haloacid dehalogenase domain protein hydrolase [Bryobacterales bacterium]|nr:Haloacid dehalogenase domain protein hydrolase [Bryobacterales bacterium]